MCLTSVSCQYQQTQNLGKQDEEMGLQRDQVYFLLALLIRARQQKVVVKPTDVEGGTHSGRWHSVHTHAHICVDCMDIHMTPTCQPLEVTV